MAKLQLACDLITLDELERMIPALQEYVDIFEMGTPFCLKYGAVAVSRIHEKFPAINILADTKIFDGGEAETKMYCDSGAKYVTVMSRTNDATIESCATTCHANGAECFVDMMCETDFAKRVPELEALGADIVAVHVAYDFYIRYGVTPLSSLAELSQHVRSAKTAVAGGITLESVANYLQYGPEIIIVGGGILGAEDPVDMARRFSHIIRN